MNDYDYYRQVLGWRESLGEDISRLHLRNGHQHAKFDPQTKQLVDLHYDEIDPNNSVSDLVKHMWQSNLGKVVLGIAAIGVVGLALKK